MSARISFRLHPETKEVATHVAQINGMTLAGMVREFLYRYVLTEPPAVRSLPTTRGGTVTTLFIGHKLAQSARIVAERNNEDLSRPIVEFLTQVATQWQDTHPPTNDPGETA